MSFQSLKIIEPILKSLDEQGYQNPTPIQKQSIPIVLNREDLLGCAQTGTGKTAAFAIPILQLLNESKSDNQKLKIRSLILTPTRELAIQISESFNTYGKYLKIKNLVIFGGVSQVPQVNELKKGIDVLIATPGRLLDLFNQGHINFKSIEYFVLDEADRMLDMGFLNDVKKIIHQLPTNKQNLFFSATMPPEIVKLSSSLLNKPKNVTVTPVSSTVEIIQQSVFFVDKGNKNQLLLHLLNTENIVTALVFTRTKHGADKVVKFLLKNNIKAEAIHGNKAQNARQRALTNFKNQTTRVLVATDIAARGIDVDNLEFVINFDLTNLPETYVHRIGRTGRAGAKGAAFSFCDHEEKAYLRDIEKLINKKIDIQSNHPFPMGSAVQNKSKENAEQNNSNGQTNTQKPKLNKSNSRKKWYNKPKS